MLAQRLLRLSRPAQRFAPARSVTRRFNHSDSKLPSWVVDNEFNRERAAVKHHAAATSGAYPNWLSTSFGCTRAGRGCIY